ncbi:MAG: B12-binding domain-containing radical SAM protein [Promethearchaeota archaeon]
MRKNVVLLLPAPLFAFAQSYDPPGATMLILGTYLANRGIKVSLRSQSVPAYHSGETFQKYPGSSDLSWYLNKSEKILAEHPEATHLAISCWQSSLYVGAILTALVARQVRPELPIIVGGYHPSVVPEDFQQKLGYWKEIEQKIQFYNVPIPEQLTELEEVATRNPDQVLFDYVVRGPGEAELYKIVTKDNGCRKTTNTSWGQIPETGPQINWELLENSEFSSLYPFKIFNKEENTGRSRVRTLLSRGCVFRCRFCLEQGVRGNKWLAMSPREAIDHILDIENRFNPTNIAFSDACFGMKRDWRDKFLRLLNDTPTNTKFWTDPRLDQISKESFEAYAKKFFALYLALESGSPQQLVAMDKTRNPEKFLNHFAKIIEWNNNHELKIQTTILVAFPGENFQTIVEAAEYWKRVARIDGQNGVSSVLGAVSSYSHWPGCYTWNNEDYFTEKYGSSFIDQHWWDLLFDSEQDLSPWFLQAVNPSHNFSWLHGQMARFELASCLMENMNVSWREDSQKDPETRFQLFDEFIQRWKGGKIKLRKDWLNIFDRLLTERQNWVSNSMNTTKPLYVI